MADLGHVKYPDGIEQTITNAFMGLYGATSPLPTHYAEQMALQDYQGGPQPIREFFNAFTTACSRSSTAPGPSTASR